MNNKLTIYLDRSDLIDPDLPYDNIKMSSLTKDAYYRSISRSVVIIKLDKSFTDKSLKVLKCKRWKE